MNSKHDETHRGLDPIAPLERAVVWAMAVGLLVLLLASGGTTRWDDALYDLHMRHWSWTPGDDVIIVAIDPKSLAALGRWPWPRELHARLIDRLTADKVRGIGMDVTIAEADADHPQNDQALAAAIARSKHVVMPVFAEPAELGGTPEEMLPIPVVATAAAALGHVGVAIDDDDVARGAYLKAGLGIPYWPSLALAQYQLDQPANTRQLPGLRTDTHAPPSPYLWMRDHFVLLRYAGPAGSFGRVSYVDVLDGEVPAQLLRGRQVLIGATAEGLGDIISTPAGQMPGVEYQANVLASLQRGITILPLNFTARFLLGSAMLLLPVGLYRLPGFRRAWRVVAVSMLFCLLLSLLLLRMAHVWWPPVAYLLMLMLGGVALWLPARLNTITRRRL